MFFFSSESDTDSQFSEPVQLHWNVQMYISPSHMWIEWIVANAFSCSFIAAKEKKIIQHVTYGNQVLPKWQEHIANTIKIMLNNKRLKNRVEQTIESGKTLEMSINFAFTHEHTWWMQLKMKTKSKCIS